MYQNDPTKVLTGEVRLSYVNLVEPSSFEQGGEKKYSAQLLIPKIDVNTLNDIKNAIMAAVESSVSKKWGGVRPQIDFTDIIHDGDGVKPKAKTPYGEECKGHWVLNASSNALSKPWVCGIDNMNCELIPQDIYSGMYARCLINFYGYKNRGVGVGCGLNVVAKTRDGEPLSGANNAALASGLEKVIGQAAAPATSPDYGAAQGGLMGATPGSYGTPVAGGFGAATPQINPITGLPM